jgi:hypothetical protein
LAEPAIHEACFIDNVTDLAPSVPRKIPVPGAPEALNAKSMFEPLLYFDQAVVERRVAFRRVSSRSRCSGEGRPRLMFRAADIQNAEGQAGYINASGGRMDDSRLRSFSFRRSHVIRELFARKNWV